MEKKIDTNPKHYPSEDLEALEEKRLFKDEYMAEMFDSEMKKNNVSELNSTYLKNYMLDREFAEERNLKILDELNSLHSNDEDEKFEDFIRIYHLDSTITELKEYLYKKESTI